MPVNNNNGVAVPELPQDGQNQGSNNVIQDKVSEIGTIHYKDSNAPLIIFFGPKGFGKTVAIIRLVRYLRQKGLTVRPDRTFREGEAYERVCDQFESITDPTSHEQPKGTPPTDYMLIKVMEQGNVIFRILDAAGEDYFRGGDIEEGFPDQIKEVFRRSRKRIWVFLLTRIWIFDTKDKVHYMMKIKGMKDGTGVNTVVMPQDRILFLCTRVDDSKQEVVFRNYSGVLRPDKALLHRYVRQEYHQDGVNMFEPYDNHHFLSRLWRKYNYKLVPYSSCTVDSFNNFNWHDDDGYYPRILWTAISNRSF